MDDNKVGNIELIGQTNKIIEHLCSALWFFKVFKYFYVCIMHLCVCVHLCICVFTCARMHSCKCYCIPVRNQRAISESVFPFAYFEIGLLLLFCPCVLLAGWSVSLQRSPASAHPAVGVLILHTCVSMHNFIWVLGVQTQVLMLE